MYYQPFRYYGRSPFNHRLSKLHSVFLALLLYFSIADIDECENSRICAFGKCVNILNGDFYTCKCEDGYEMTGDASTGSLRCTGEF